MSEYTFGEIQITSTSNPPAEYATMLKAVRNKEQLLAGIRKFGELAYDAYVLAEYIEDWDEFYEAMQSEQRGTYMGDALAEKYSLILLPDAMFITSVIAQTMKVPFGLALIRLLQSGRIFVENGYLNMDSLK